ncbi:zinc finger MYM-type protein 1-like isoform X1 [Scomber scombrus]|uniref:Zinc finger MYM-type protein 1-like isoform X1 n=1 Tax=Scomber scombrus TaxID=13677 RepID=A0AAV1Q3H9_SCOSC
MSGPAHIQHLIALKTFGKCTPISLALNEANRLQVSVHNVKVRENREILKDLKRATYFLAKQELAFRRNDESEGSSNRGNYVELLNVLAEKDERLETHLQVSTVFTGTSNRI